MEKLDLRVDKEYSLLYQLNISAFKKCLPEIPFFVEI